VAQDIDENTLNIIKEWAEQFPRELKYFEGLVHKNRIFVDRIAGVGIMPPEKAIQLGLTGPTLRGSGVPRDLRRDTPYLVYNQLDFDVITFNDCDVWSRYMVRIQEMKESLKNGFSNIRANAERCSSFEKPKNCSSTQKRSLYQNGRTYK
jgi:NADH-quinone oxidoreductase subunit D